jgi:hypothetical protein
MPSSSSAPSWSSSSSRALPVVAAAAPSNPSSTRPRSPSPALVPDVADVDGGGGVRSEEIVDWLFS